MNWAHNFAVSLLIFPLVLYGLVVLATMFAYYETWRVLRELAMIVPRKKPIMRDKFDVMTFTQWWNEKRRHSRAKMKLRSNLKCFIRSKRKGCSRIGTRKDRHVFRISESHTSSKDQSSEHYKDDRSRVQKIVFDTDSFPIGACT